MCFLTLCDFEFFHSSHSWCRNYFPLDVCQVLTHGHSRLGRKHGVILMLKRGRNIIKMITLTLKRDFDLQRGRAKTIGLEIVFILATLFRKTIKTCLSSLCRVKG